MILCSVNTAKRLYFRKEMLTLFSVLCVSVILGIFHFGFDGWTLVLIESILGHCLLYTFQTR